MRGGPGAAVRALPPGVVGVIMAAVTGELTGRPGAALSTLGPGVTASATGLAHAFLDRAPMIYVSDRHPEAALSLHHARPSITGRISGSIVKASMTLDRRIGEPRRGARRAARVEGASRTRASGSAGGRLGPTGRAGPRANPTAPSADPFPSRRTLDQRGRGDHPRGAAARSSSPGSSAARPRPSGSAHSARRSRAAPHTYKAKGAIPDPHPLALGVFTGGALEEAIVRRADLIVGVGLDPVELIPRPWPYTAPVLSLRRAALDASRAHASRRWRLLRVGARGRRAISRLILEELAPRLIRADARPTGRGRGRPARGASA